MSKKYDIIWIDTSTDDARDLEANADLATLAMREYPGASIKFLHASNVQTYLVTEWQGLRVRQLPQRLYDKVYNP